MIKTIEQMKDQEGFKIFQDFFSECCNACLESLMSHIEILKDNVDAEFVNLEEVKEDIKQLVLVKLTVKVPEKYIDEVPVINGEKEPKKKKATKKKAKPVKKAVKVKKK
jgi:hypothetical protein